MYNLSILFCFQAVEEAGGGEFGEAVVSAGNINLCFILLYFFKA